MNYNIIWLAALEDELARIYLLAKDDGLADRLTYATARIDQLLSSQPGTVGESRDGRSRVAIESPLTVNFEVLEAERVVIVTKIHYSKPKN